MSKDFSCLILEEIQYQPKLILLNEQELKVLNEGFKDFFVSIKDMTTDRIKKMISAKYEQLENVKNKNEKILKKNNINTNKLSSIINNVVIRYKSKIERAGRNRDGKALSRIVQDVGIKAKSEIETKKSTWFNFKYSDPENFLVPLFITMIIIAIKAMLLILVFSVFSISGGGIGAVIFQAIFIFILLPVLEEAGRLFSIKSGIGGSFTIIYNAVDFSLMFATKIITSGFSNILIFILVRLFSTAISGANWHIQKMGNLTDTSDVSFKISWCLNAMRNFIEIITITCAKVYG